MPILPTCPRCGSTETVRSHRRLIERIMMIVRPYRCEFCSHRFIVLRPQDKSKNTITSNSK